MIQLNLTVKKFCTALTILGCVAQTSTACATLTRNPASPNDGNQTNITITSTPETEKDKQLKTPPLILDTKEIFDKLSRSPVEGPRTVGGGNSCALSITQNTTTLVELLSGDGYYGLLEEKKKNLVISTLKKARFYLQDNLVINGQAKDAMNFPAQGVIYVSPKFCATELIEVSGRSMSLLLHEYLELARIDDRNYQISGKFLSMYANEKSTDAKTKAWLTNEMKRDLQGKKSCFAGAVPKKLKELSEGATRIDPESLRVEIQPIESFGPFLDDRDCGDDFLDKNMRKTEDETKAIYRICYARRINTYFTVIPFDEAWHGQYGRGFLFYKVESKETTTTVKKKDAGTTEGYVNQSVKTTYDCKPFEFNWEKVGIKDNN